MSSDESDGDALDGLDWDLWKDSAFARRAAAAHSTPLCEISADAAAMPSQKAVCYGYYPSFELNSMLLVKCKVCSMLVKDVGYGHHVRSRHAFRAESPNSGDECQAFLLSPPHCIASPRHSDSAIISPPYRKPSTSFQIGGSSEEHSRAAVSARPISARYSIEQRDDLKLALRVSRREVTNDAVAAPLLTTRNSFTAAEVSGKANALVDGEERKPVITAQATKAVNGRAKQKKRKKRKADSSSSDDFSLDHFRRKKRLDSERLNDMSAVPSTSTALHVDLSNVDEVPLAGEQRLLGIASSPLLCISSRASLPSRSSTRSSPKVTAELEGSEKGGGFVANAAQYVPLSLPQHPSSYRDFSESVSPFDYSSPEGTSETSMGLRSRGSAETKLKSGGTRKASAQEAGSSPKNLQQLQQPTVSASASRASSRGSAHLSPISERNTYYLNFPPGVSNVDSSLSPTEEPQVKRRASVFASPSYSSPVLATSYSSSLATPAAETFTASESVANCDVTLSGSSMENFTAPKEEELTIAVASYGSPVQNTSTDTLGDAQVSLSEKVSYRSPMQVTCRDAYTSPITVNCVEAACQSSSLMGIEDEDVASPDEAVEVHTFRSPADESSSCSISRLASPLGLVAVAEAHSGGAEPQLLQLQQQEVPAEELQHDVEAVTSGVKDVADEVQEKAPLPIEAVSAQNDASLPGPVDADACALIAAFSAPSRSEEEVTPFKEVNENEQNSFVAMKQERADSPSSSASVIALSPEIPISEVEATGGILREDESEEETDSALHRTAHRCSHVHFIAPAVRPRRPHASSGCDPSGVRVHRSCSSPSCDPNDCCVRPESFSQRRHVDLQIANVRMLVAQGMGISLTYPSLANPTPPSFVSLKQTRQCGVPNKVERCSPSPRAPSESTVSSNLDPPAEMPQLSHTTSTTDFSLQGSANMLASEQTPCNEETVRATQSLEPEGASSMAVQNGGEAPVRLSSAPQHRPSNSPFTSSVPSSRVASAVNGVTARALDQNGRMLHTLRARSGTVQKTASPLILSANGASLHALPSHGAPTQQLRYVYIQTGSSMQPGDFDGVYETADDELIPETLESDVYEGLSVMREPKGAGGRLLRQISAQRVYDPPPVLKKMRLSVHEPAIRNDAILTAVSSSLPSGIARRLSRQAVDSVSSIDASFYIPTSSSTGTLNGGSRMTLGGHSYPVSSGVGRVVSPFAFAKGGQRSSMAACSALPRTFAAAHSFRRVSSAFSSNANSKPTLAGGAVMNTQIASGGSGAAGVERGLSVVSHGGGVRGATLAGVRTGPRTVTVVPVLSKYAPPASPRLLTGMTAALFRTSPQSTLPPASSNAVTCMSPITTETRTC